HQMKIMKQIKRNAIREKRAPLPVQPLHRHVINHTLAASLEQLLENMRHRQNGRAKVEAEAILLKAVQFSAKMFVPLVQRNFVPFLCKGNRSGQAAESSSDYEYGFSWIGHICTVLLESIFFS